MIDGDRVNKFNQIPKELRNLEQWVLWRLEKRDGKSTKVPYQDNGLKALADDPRTWSTFDRVVRALELGGSTLNGIGFVFSKTDSYLGVDLDDCLENGQLTEGARNILNGLNSYSERSQSRQGVHVIVKGAKLGDRCKSKRIPGMKELEMYDHGRFFVMTGDHFGNMPECIYERQEQVNKLYCFAFPPEPLNKESNADTVHDASVVLTDDLIIELLANARNGEKFKRIYYGGNMADYGNDWSRADQALINMIAFYTQDEEQSTESSGKERSYGRSGVRERDTERRQ
jgi:primase-polymerase (primpol)-like protein